MQNFRTQKNNGKTKVFKRKYFVYMVTNPKTFEIIYIGYSSNIGKRYRDEIKLFSNSSTGLLNEYLLTLKINSLSPKFSILKEFENKNDALSMEKKLIKKYQPFCNTIHKK